MNDPLSRVLLRWGDSNLYWWPLGRLRPPKTDPLGLFFALTHALTGLLWAGLPFALLAGLWSARPAPILFLAPGAVGALASGTFALFVRAAWNRRAASHRQCLAQGEPIPTPVPAEATPFERGVVEPILVLGVLGLALTLVYGFENLRGSLALRSFHAELRAAHAPVSIADIVPPAIPEERNLAFGPLLRPLTDYTRVEKPGPGPSVIWNDTNGWARASHMFHIEDPARSMARYLRDREKARRTNQVESGQNPDVSESQNPTGRRASWLAGQPVDLELWQEYYRSIPGWPQTPEPQTPARDVLLALTRYDSELQELRAEASARPECRFPLAYEEGFNMLLAPLAPLKATGQFLRLRAAALLAEDRPAEALADTLLGLRLSDTLADQPILISALVRVAMDQLALQPIWEGCLGHRWSEAQMSELQAALARRDYLAELRRGLQGERILSTSFYDGLVRSAASSLGQFDANAGTGFEDLMTLFVRGMPRGWVRHNQVAHGRYVQALVRDLAEAPHHAALPPGETHLAAIQNRPSPASFLARLLVPAIDRASERIYQAEAARRLALVGLALERHRAATGSYPDRLEELAPRFLSVLPNDPMDGRPLRYRRQNDGAFRLYSIGLDHADNEGRRQDPDRKRKSTAEPDAGTDLVWR